MDMKRFTLLLVLVSACAAAPAPAPQPAAAPPPQTNAIESKTAKLQKLDGYFPLYWDEQNGRLLMRIGRLGEEFLYVCSLPAGVGSNPIGLDRGQEGESQ